MAKDDPTEIRITTDDELLRDVDTATKLTGIRSRTDLVRHALKVLIGAYGGKK